ERVGGVVSTGPLALGRLDENVLERQPLSCDEVREVVSERRGILSKILLGFLEAHEDAVLACGSSVDQELQCEQRFSASWPATDKSRPSCGEAPFSDLIEPVDARCDLGKGCRSRRLARARGLTMLARHLRLLSISAGVVPIIWAYGRLTKM